MRERSQRPAMAYLGALRAHRLLAACVLVATLAGAFLFLQARAENYEATSEVLVTPLPVEQQALLSLPLITEAPDATRVSQTAAALLRSNSAAATVADGLGPDWSRERVLDAVEVQPRGESNVIAVTAHADSARLAQRIANDYMGAALEERQSQLRQQIPGRIETLRAQIEASSPGEAAELGRRVAALRSIEGIGDPTLSVSQAAVAPTESASPSRALIGAAAIVVGLGLAVAAALLATVFDRRIRREDELFALFPIPVLARIPDASASSPRAAEAFRTLLAELEAKGGPSGVVLVTSATTGDGKTTCAMQLARAAREAGRRVIFLDFDLRQQDAPDPTGGPRAEQLLGLAPEALASAPRLRAGGSLDEALVPASEDSSLMMALPPLAGDTSFAALGAELPRLISEARGRTDLVIVDTPPLGEVGDALRLLESIDRLLITVRLGNTRRSGFEVVRDLVLRSRKTPEGLIVMGAGGGETQSPYQRELASPAARGIS